MPLNDRELAELAALEAQLVDDDPKLAARLGGTRPARPSHRPALPSALGMAGSLAALPVAVETGFYPLGLAGFVASVYFGAKLYQAVGRTVTARIAKAFADDTETPPTSDSR